MKNRVRNRLAQAVDGFKSAIPVLKKIKNASTREALPTRGGAGTDEIIDCRNVLANRKARPPGFGITAESCKIAHLRPHRFGSRGQANRFQGRLIDRYVSFCKMARHEER
ncbi:hypothetical protein [Bradyrhizobium sp. 5.13L]